MRAGVCFVQDGPDTTTRNRVAVHECFHLFQYRQRLDNIRAANALTKLASTSKALPHLRKHGYDVGDAREIISEMAAYIFSGDHAFIGLGRTEAEEWFSAYCRQHAMSYRLKPRT